MSLSPPPFPKLLHFTSPHLSSSPLLCFCSSSPCPVSFSACIACFCTLTGNQSWESAAFFALLFPYPPCLYCLNILYMFRLTCIVCCLGLFRHAKPCCMSTLVCTCMSLRKITKTYKEIHATWTHIACIWMKPNANLLFSSVLSGLHNSKLWNKHEILRQCKGLAPLYHLLLCWIDIFLLHTSFIHGFIRDLWFWRLARSV